MKGKRESIDKTKVLFRKWKDTGDVTAMFPEVPSNLHGSECMAYEHFGQHGAAFPENVISHTSPATSEEYAELKVELERLGYVLEVRQRLTASMRERRQAVARKEREG